MRPLSCPLALLPALMALRCGGATTAPEMRPASVAVPVQAPESATSAAAPAQPAPVIPDPRAIPQVQGVAALEAPEEAGCAYTIGETHANQSLRFSAETEPYVHVYNHRKLRLWLPVGEPVRGAFLEVQTGGVTLQGYALPEDVSLYASLPMVLGECMMPSSSAVLEWVTTTPGQVTLTFENDAVELVDGATSVTRACAEVSPREADYDVEKAFGATAPPDEPLSLLGVDKIPLRAAPEGPVVAYIRGSNGKDRAVRVLEQLGALRRITWWMDDILVFGWVESRYLQPAGLVGYGTGHGRLGLGAIGTPRRTQCEHELPLIAEHDGERRVVGIIEPGKRFALGEQRGGLNVIAIDRVGFEFVQRLTLLVPSGAVAHCK